MSNRPKTLYVDIENIPCTGWFWRTGKQVVTSEQVLEPGRIICISYLWEHEMKAHTFTWDKRQDDKTLLKDFSKVAEQADVIIGHNSTNFDVKHINARLAYHGLSPINWSLLDDTLQQLRRSLNLPSFKLDYVCKYFGLGEKIRTGGIDLWKDVWLKNDRKALERMSKYCEGDVYLAKALEGKIRPYVKTKLNYARFIGSSELSPCCGFRTQSKGLRQTTKGLFQRRECLACLKSFSVGKNQTTGISEFPR